MGTDFAFIVIMLTRKITWSLDPFEENQEFQKNLYQTLVAWVGSRSFEVVPVHVLSVGDSEVAAEMNEEDCGKWREVSSKAISSVLQGLDGCVLQEPRTLLQASFSCRDSVAGLLDEAHAMGSELIAVGTHGRKGLNRFLLGSFAETLLLESDLPLLVVNPECEPVEKLVHMVYPTDLSEGSLKVLYELLPEIRERDLKVTLYHKLPRTVEAAVSAGAQVFGASYLPLDRFYKKQKEMAEAQLEQVQSSMESKGVSCLTFLDMEPTPAVDGIAALTDSIEGSFVGIVAQSGPFSSALLGSLVRQVVRTSRVPVWVKGKGER